MDDMLTDETPTFGDDAILESAAPPTRIPSPALSATPNYHAINRWPGGKFNARMNPYAAIQNLEAQSETSLQDPVEERGVVRKVKDDPDWNNIGVQWKNGRRPDENGDCVSTTNQELLEINAKIQDIGDVPKDLNRWDHDHTAQAERVERLIRKLAVGFTMGADDLNETKWIKFSIPRMVSRLDTVEFMSPGLTMVFSSKEPYLHSPVDDFYAHFYVAQWAAVFHPTTGTFKRKEALRTQLSTNNNRDGVKAMVAVLRASPADIRDFGGFLCKCASLFGFWDAKLRELWGDYYRTAFDEVDHVEDNGELLTRRSLFRAYAYRGVADYMEVLAKWKEANPSEV
ncbi:hypothetical protein MIND_00134500 [Mycena indigotica]|uniref:Uncharacterized protein n=1 Tax=Mycena indigotica TaxID=2126181 RepID=A0A8H6TED7_9AGAR|nr:uncharacterized protein MIND_00134500 [Mycena indigotica]KAF7316163.1 hypothetical protein MIND_00134500 [Mycena indigotica]